MKSAEILHRHKFLLHTDGVFLCLETNRICGQLRFKNRYEAMVHRLVRHPVAVGPATRPCLTCNAPVSNSSKDRKKKMYTHHKSCLGVAFYHCNYVDAQGDSCDVADVISDNVRGHITTVHSGAANPDQLLVSNDRIIRMWDIKTRRRAGEEAAN